MGRPFQEDQVRTSSNPAFRTLPIGGAAAATHAGLNYQGQTPQAAARAAGEGSRER
jgi:hypothetical protein